MTGRVLSLSRVRKDRARARKRAEADANAAKFGRTKAEKMRDAAREDISRARHEAHRRDGE